MFFGLYKRVFCKKKNYIKRHTRRAIMLSHIFSRPSAYFISLCSPFIQRNRNDKRKSRIRKFVFLYQKGNTIKIHPFPRTKNKREILFFCKRNALHTVRRFLFFPILRRSMALPVCERDRFKKPWVRFRFRFDGWYV